MSSRSIVNFYNCSRYWLNRLRGNIDTCTFSRWGCNAIRIRNICSSCYTSCDWRQYIQTKFCRSYCQFSCTYWLIDCISFISDFNGNRRCFWFNICNRNVLGKTTLICQIIFNRWSFWSSNICHLECTSRVILILDSCSIASYRNILDTTINTMSCLNISYQSCFF